MGIIVVCGLCLIIILGFLAQISDPNSAKNDLEQEKRYRVLAFKNGINRHLESGPACNADHLTATYILIYGHNDLSIIEPALKDWEARGLLKIIKPISECKPEDECVQMLSFIDQKSLFKNFLNWEDPEPKRTESNQL